ncbi:MAG: hypothetical protein SFT92_08680 [Rickettsiales bacterium]|nr:hypothetical protein [Rickettsiales bacterium]
MNKPVDYPKVGIGTPIICFERDPEQLVTHMRTLHEGAFAESVNREIKRLEGYYLACSDWLNNASRSRSLATHLGLEQTVYEEIAKQEHYLSHRILEKLEAKAQEQGHSPAQIQQWENDAQLVNVKNIARQRMLMMQSILHASPVIMRDPFGGGKAGEYGFGDGKVTQIFEGKASVGEMKFSATASPKMHGYVFRFAVCNVPKTEEGYNDNNPAMILDNRIVDGIEAWHKEKFGDKPLEENPLLASMAENLYPNIHDWVHSWLLYDVKSKSKDFQQWGADIFFDVPHLIQNKLVINYEMLSMSLHRYVWNTLMDHEPDIKEHLYEKLEDYMKQIKDYSAWVAEHQGAEVAQKQEEYLAYAVLTNITFVLDPKEERMQKILDEYPTAKAQLDKILGKALDLLHSDVKGIPSQRTQGELEDVDRYTMRYPMADEVQARLKAQRIGSKSGETVTLPSGSRIYTENLAEFEKMPETIRVQVKNVRDSNTYGVLNRALEKLPEALRDAVAQRVELDDAGRMFFRVKREEVDLEKLDKRTQDKRVLLVQVPKGQRIPIHPRVQVSLLEQVKRQETWVTDKDIVAFNVADKNIADQILEAGHGTDIPAMIAKAKQLAASGREDADDIYPLSVEKAKQIYEFKGSGFYESLNRERYVARADGPMVMKLHDDSNQRVFDGVIIYIPDNEKPFKDDTNPDLHFAEGKDFVRTHQSPSGVKGLKSITLKASSELAKPLGDAELNRALDEFLPQLDTINRMIDHGEGHALAKRMF